MEELWDIDEKFKWDNQKILLLLSLYKKLKTQFRDPKMPKRKLWKFIEQKFAKRNYLANADMLDKKFRNLKQTYNRVKNKQRSGGGRITWEYLEEFENIFGDEDDRKTSITISSPIQTSKIDPDSTIWLNNLETASTSLIEENSQSVKYDTINVEYTNTSNIEAEMLKIENIKVQKLSEIADSMKERNELLRNLIDILSNTYK